MLTKPFYGRVLFDPDKGNNPPVPNPDPTPNPVTPPKEEDGPKVTLTQAELDARMAAARKDGRTAAERAAQETKDAADAAKAIADQEAKGQYDTAKAALEGQVATVTGERDTLKTENDALLAYFATQYASALAELPEFITAFAPADDASVTVKSAWLTKAQEQAAKIGGPVTPGNRPNPKPGDGKRDLDAAAQQARASGRYTI